ncbi:hypothetical protein K0C01_11740 [Salinarchaeum sp. IM2453]|uniref:hypothetical protein n=1 Tax=Salinarchaeum sp. IM2453 TaxID=2862870 RepID=UPI001C834F50|nr:hypothetical protein [Salinarchaeum sp. IM2453]QZA88438.1 hypothetical protein K0C01_11740 [Salinarchaeum sp. IM2453]
MNWLIKAILKAAAGKVAKEVVMELIKRLKKAVREQNAQITLSSSQQSGTSSA